VEPEGIRAELDAASSLWSAAGGVWRCSGGKLCDDLFPDGAQVVASRYFPTGTAITWRGRATRSGKKGNLLVGDAVGVPVSPYSDGRVVPVAEGAAVMEDSCAVRCFLTAAFSRLHLDWPLLLYILFILYLDLPSALCVVIGFSFHL